MIHKPAANPPFDTLLQSYLAAADQAFVLRAYQFACQGLDQASHPDGRLLHHHATAVANQLAQWQAPAAVLAAALLAPMHANAPLDLAHLNQLATHFSLEVAQLVQNLASHDQLSDNYATDYITSTSERLAVITSELPWLVLTLQRSPTAVVIRLADKLQQFQSLANLPLPAQTAFATNVNAIFVPFADRLGMKLVKYKLEDAAFAVLQPELFASMQKRYPVAKRTQAMLPLLQQVGHALAQRGIAAHVKTQTRSFFDLYRLESSIKSELPFYLIDPIVVIVEDVAACYQALGAVNSIWPPQLSQISDLIAAPRANGYRALHTRLHFQPDEVVIVLIRDQAMQVIAEAGITAVWCGYPSPIDLKFPGWQDPPPGKINLLTPSGDIMTLPKGATPIDFAYAIHIGLGHQCTGAMVNGRTKSLNTPLENGDVVRILTGMAHVGPSPEWLSFTKTKRARTAIRRWFKTEHDNHFSPPNSPDNLALKEAQPAPKAILRSLAEADLPQRIAACCRPDPPDDIVGYVTKNHVVSIHRANCARVRGLRPLIEAYWENMDLQLHKEIYLLVLDRPGLVRDVSQVVANAQLNMNAFFAERGLDGSAQIRIVLGEVPHWKTDQLLTELNTVPGIRFVERRTPSFSTMLTNSGVERNPYTLRPVTGHAFYGRQRELMQLIQNLRDVRPGEAVLLWGPRRVGKTSLLLQLEQHIMNNRDYIMVFIDMQRLSGRSTTIFIRDILRKISEAVGEPQTAPKFNRLRQDPLGYFRSFLDNSPILRRKHLVLILDEFQLLADLSEEEVTLADINHTFRSLIQHQGGLTIIFSGGGVLDMLLRQSEASFMLEVARYQKIEGLDEAAARQLVEEPARHIRYSATAVDHLLYLTARHPYYLQWICGELMTWAEREQWQQIDKLHLQLLLDEWLPQQGEQFFNHLWGSSTKFNARDLFINKLLLTVLATQADAHSFLSLSQIEAHFPNQILSKKDSLWYMLQNLAKMDTVLMKDEQYTIQIPLFHRWMQLTTPLTTY